MLTRVQREAFFNAMRLHRRQVCVSLRRDLMAGSQWWNMTKTSSTGNLPTYDPSSIRNEEIGEGERGVLTSDSRMGSSLYNERTPFYLSVSHLWMHSSFCEHTHFLKTLSHASLTPVKNRRTKRSPAMMMPAHPAFRVPKSPYIKVEPSRIEPMLCTSKRNQVTH
jgi:hypothetical protein